MSESATHAASYPRLAAQDRHGTKESVPLALSTFVPRRPASAMHGYLTTRATDSDI